MRGGFVGGCWFEIWLMTLGMATQGTLPLFYVMEYEEISKNIDQQSRQS